MSTSTAIGSSPKSAALGRGSGLGCIGPTNAAFAMDPVRAAARLGEGFSSEPIGDVVSNLLPARLGQAGLTVQGVDDPNVKPVAPISLSEDFSMIVEWANVSSTNTKRTVFHIENDTGLLQAELYFNVSNQLIWEVGGQIVNLGTGGDDTNTHRAAVTYDKDGNFAGSFDGGTTVSGTGATPITDVGQIALGNNNGSSQLNGVLRHPFAGIGIELTPQQMEDASDLITSYACGPFPDNMSFGAFDSGFDSGFE